MNTQPPTTNMNGVRTILQGIGSLPALVAIFMLALAFNAGVRNTHDLTWPPYVDQERDASFANSILDGHYGDDPLYSGEAMWFTPMLFTLEAYAVKLTGVDMQLLQARAGAYWNLLGPICFLLLAWRWFGSSIALVALAAYLFVMPGQEPGWALSSYSPWFLPMSFSQGFFYLMLLGLSWAFHSTSWKKWAVVGTGAGLLFMSHAAPAILIVAFIAIHILSSMISAWRKKEKGLARRYLLIGIAAGAAFILVSLPLTWYVIGEYMLDQKNPKPAAFTYEPLSLRHAHVFLYHNVSLLMALGIAGLVLLYRGKESKARTLMLWWVGMTAALAVYAYTAVVLGVKYQIKIPTSVPAFHFYAYLKAALALSTGIAVVWFLRWAVVRYDRNAPEQSIQKRSSAIIIGLVVVGTVLLYPTNANRSGLINTRTFSLIRMADTDAMDMYHTLRSRLPWEAVVLCDEQMSMWVLMASARKTVATNASMANPYVLPAPRKKARTQLLSALERPTPDTRKYLDEYGVTHVLVRTADIERMHELARWFPKLVHQNGTYALLSR